MNKKNLILKEVKTTVSLSKDLLYKLNELKTIPREPLEDVIAKIYKYYINKKGR
jgi:hypothetical protein